MCVYADVEVKKWESGGDPWNFNLWGGHSSMLDGPWVDGEKALSLSNGSGGGGCRVTPGISGSSFHVPGFPKKTSCQFREGVSLRWG